MLFCSLLLVCAQLNGYLFSGGVPWHVAAGACALGEVLAMVMLAHSQHEQSPQQLRQRLQHWPTVLLADL